MNQTVKIPGNFRHKINRILNLMREHTFRDIETLKTICMEPDVRYYDVAFLKEKLKAIMLSRDANSIQMLTCFSLTNTIKGMMILAAENFNQEINVKTVLYTPSTDTIQEF